MTRRLLEIPTKIWVFLLGIDIGGGYGGAGERTLPSLFPATQWQLRGRGNPSLSKLAGLLCMVVTDRDPLFVLAKCKELVRDSIRKSC
jgi:hypothetical protein